MSRDASQIAPPVTPATYREYDMAISDSPGTFLVGLNKLVRDGWKISGELQVSGSNTHSRIFTQLVYKIFEK